MLEPSLKNMTVYGSGLGEGITVTTVTSQNNVTISTLLTLADNTPLRFVEPAGILRLETGTATATDLGHSIISEFLKFLVTHTPLVLTRWFLRMQLLIRVQLQKFNLTKK